MLVESPDGAYHEHCDSLVVVDITEFTDQEGHPLEMEGMRKKGIQHCRTVRMPLFDLERSCTED